MLIQAVLWACDAPHPLQYHPWDAASWTELLRARRCQDVWGVPSLCCVTSDLFGDLAQCYVLLCRRLTVYSVDLYVDTLLYKTTLLYSYTFNVTTKERDTLKCLCRSEHLQTTSTTKTLILVILLLNKLAPKTIPPT